MRLVILDQVRLQGQGFRFAVGDDEFDLTDLPHHQADTGTMTTGFLEIRAHTVAQHLGLTDIKNCVFAVAHQIAARLGGNLPQPGC